MKKSVVVRLRQLEQNQKKIPPQQHSQEELNRLARLYAETLK